MFAFDHGFGPFDALGARAADDERRDRRGARRVAGRLPPSASPTACARATTPWWAWARWSRRTFREWAVAAGNPARVVGDRRTREDVNENLRRLTTNRAAVAARSWLPS